MAVVLVMVGLAISYVALGAPFLGVVQIVVYTGAVMMLFLFVLMLVGVDQRESLKETITGQRWIALRAFDRGGGPADLGRVPRAVRRRQYLRGWRTRAGRAVALRGLRARRRDAWASCSSPPPWERSCSPTSRGSSRVALRARCRRSAWPQEPTRSTRPSPATTRVTTRSTRQRSIQRASPSKNRSRECSRSGHQTNDGIEFKDENRSRRRELGAKEDDA